MFLLVNWARMFCALASGYFLAVDTSAVGWLENNMWHTESDMLNF